MAHGFDPTCRGKSKTLCSSAPCAVSMRMKTMMSHLLPTCPWQIVSMDLFNHAGKDSLLTFASEWGFEHVMSSPRHPKDCEKPVQKNTRRHWQCPSLWQTSCWCFRLWQGFLTSCEWNSKWRSSPMIDQPSICPSLTSVSPSGWNHSREVGRPMDGRCVPAAGRP